MESTNVAFIGSTKSGKGITARVGFAEGAETPIDWRLAIRCVEPGRMVRFFWSIAFFAFATSLFAGETLTALVSAAQEFSVGIQDQLAAVQSDISATELLEKTVSDAKAKAAYFNALQAEAPEMTDWPAVVTVTMR